MTDDPNATLPPLPDANAATLPPVDPDATLAQVIAITGSSAAIDIDLPGYDIEAELGRGGMGVVYRARQIKLNRLVALKMVLNTDRADPRELIRFMAEAEAVAAVKHPNVVQVYEFGDHKGRPFLAMEYLDGGSLSDTLKAGKLPPTDAAALVEQLARAVQAAHDLGIVHRDLKPANILFAGIGSGGSGLASDSRRDSASGEHPYPIPDTPYPTAKVTDFGLAKRGNSDLTRTGAIMGTPAYMAPEQAKGQTKFVGPAADIYALGVILYECLTGCVPFEAEDTVSLIMKVAEEEPRSARSRTDSIPRDLDIICLKCLHKDPKKRYPTAAALADDLRRFRAGEAITARPATTREKFSRWVRKNPGKATGVGAALLLMLSAIGVLAYVSQQQHEQNLQLTSLVDQATVARNEATTARAAAEGQTRVAKENEAAANAARAAGERLRYDLNMNLAQRLFDADDPTQAAAVLASAPAQFRGWEWDYLNSLVQPAGPVLVGHLNPIHELLVSPDGKRLVTVDTNQLVRTWETATGRELFVAQRMGPHAFAPDGSGGMRVINRFAQLIAPSGEATGPQLAAEGVVAVGYADGGKTALTLSVKPPLVVTKIGVVTRWNAATGEKLGDLPVQLPGQELQYEMWQGRFTNPRFSPDGSRVAYGTQDGMVRVWTLAGTEAAKNLVGPISRVTAVAFSPDGRQVVGGFGNGRLIFWDLKSGEQVRQAEAHPAQIAAVAFSAEGSRYATAGGDGLARVWDAKTGAELFTLRGHRAGVRVVAFLPDGKTLVTGGEDSTVRLWPLADERTFSQFRTSQLSILGGKRDPFDGAPREVPGHRTFYGHVDDPWFVTFSPDGGRLLSTSNWDALGPVWDLARRTVVADRPVGQGRFAAAAWSPDGKHLAMLASRSNTGKVPRLKLWAEGDEDPKEARLPNEGYEHNPPVVAYHPDGKTVVVCAVGNRNTKIRPYAVPALDPLPELVVEDSAGVGALDFARDGKTLYVSTGDRLLGYDWPARTVAFDLPLTGLKAFAVGPGKMLVAGLADGRILVYRAGPTAGEPFVLTGYVGGANNLAVHPDGSRIASGGSDAVVRVWAADTGREVLSFKDARGTIRCVAWSPDGRRIAACGDDQAVRVYTAPPPATLADWPVVFAHDFSNPAVSATWTRNKGTWTVVNGAFKGTLGKEDYSNGGSFTKAAVQVGGVRLPAVCEVRYTVRMDKPAVLSTVIHNQTRNRPAVHAQLSAAGNRSGQVGANVHLVLPGLYGGWWSNTIGVPQSRFVPEPGRTYHVVVRRETDRLTVRVDGNVVLAESIPTEEFPSLGFEALHGEFGDAVYIDDVEVRAPAAAVNERELLDMFDKWGDEELTRKRLADRVEKSDRTPDQKAFLRGRLPAFREDARAMWRTARDSVHEANCTLDQGRRALDLFAACRYRVTNESDTSYHDIYTAIAAFRAGRYAEAWKAADLAAAPLRASDGVDPLAVVCLRALIAHRDGRPAEAQYWARRVADLNASGGYKTGFFLSQKLADEVAAAVKLPADPDADAIRTLVYTGHLAGWLNGDKATHLAMFADGATITVGRRHEPSADDIVIPKDRFAADAALFYSPFAHKGFRVSIEDAAVTVTGDTATAAMTMTFGLGEYYATYAETFALKRTSAGWRVTAVRSWPLGERGTRYDDDYYRKTAADVAATRAAGGRKLALALVEDLRHKEAFALAKQLAARPGADADDFRLLCESAYRAADPAALRDALPKYFAAGGTGEQMWYASRLRGRQPWAVESPIYGLAVRPDLRRVVYTGNGSVNFLDLVAGQSVQFHADVHNGGGSDVQMSPDGKWFSTSGNDGQLIVWDAATREKRWAISAHQPKCWRHAWSPDSTRIVTGGHDNLVKVWNAADGTPARPPLAGHTNLIAGVAWSTNGRIASASYDGIVRVWNPDTNDPPVICPGHTKGATRVAFTPGGKLLAGSGLDGTVRLWNPDDGKPVGSPMSVRSTPVEPIAFTPDGKTLVAGHSAQAAEGLICLWDVTTGRLRESFAGNWNGTFALRVSADGTTLWSGGGDGCLRTFTLDPW